MHRHQRGCRSTLLCRIYQRVSSSLVSLSLLKKCRTARHQTHPLTHFLSIIVQLEIVRGLSARPFPRPVPLSLLFYKSQSETALSMSQKTLDHLSGHGQVFCVGVISLHALKYSVKH